MSRTVSKPIYHVETVYLDTTKLIDKQDEDAYNWFIEDMQQVITDKYNSFCNISDKWIGRENKIILLNDHAYITISEY